MEDVSGKIGRGIFTALMIVVTPLVWGADKIAKGLEKLGVDNPPHDPGNDWTDNPYHP